jgi:hypothetical protein
MTDRAFTLKLAEALSGLTNGRQWGPDYSGTLTDLLPKMRRVVTAHETVAENFQRNPPDVGAPSWEPFAAGELRKQATDLLALVKKHGGTTKKAADRGDLSLSWRDHWTIKTYADARPAWTPDGEVSLALQLLVDDLARWERIAKARCRRRPGPKPWVRESAAVLVGVLLRRQGVPLKKSKAGYFARVLAVVYGAAGVATRNAYRDVCHALESAELRPS